MIDQLRTLLREVEPYPAGVLPVPNVIAGTAFFPGGHGLWMEERDRSQFPVGGIMVLGHDFHSETGYTASLERGHEDLNDPTWRQLRKLMDNANPRIDPKEVLFTNFYMGLRQGNKATGIFPGASDAGFVGRCGTFFLHQLAAQRPKLILTLGTQVPSLIARYSEDLESWRGKRSFSGIDTSGPLKTNVAFTDLPLSNDGHTTTIATLTHPCLWNSNVHRRRYLEMNGREAEVQLLNDALSSAR